MSDNSAQPMSIDELKEVYELLSKEALVNILIGKTLLIRELIEEKEKQKS